MGLGYLDTQRKMQVHFLMLVATAMLFVAGVALFLYDFFVLAPRHERAVSAVAQPAPSSRPAEA
jgi:nitric oxide reductase subunit B